MYPESPQNISFPCIKVIQPIGEFYIASIGSKTLIDITHFDVRRILKGERDIESYLGIQRPLNKKRVEEISRYVNTLDACFPTAVILAVPGVCAYYDGKKNKMTLSNYFPSNEENPIYFKDIAKVLDGQHRIEGLRAYAGNSFNINVSIFIDADIADQAYIFSTVNLAQTKVNRSLVYDLFDLARSRSPQKTCHNIAVALDQNEKTPFYKRIKRLGVSTDGRFNETITQATFVQSLITYISRPKDQMIDRDLYLRGKEPQKASADELRTLIFRNMFIEKKDLEISDIIWNYFDAVKERWPVAWNSTGTGIMLNKTNGFRGFMRFLRPAYLNFTAPGGIPTKEQFVSLLRKIQLRDEDFNIDKFKPGTSGESELYNTLIKESKLG